MKELEHGTLELVDCGVSGNKATPPPDRADFFRDIGGIGLSAGAMAKLTRCRFSGNSGRDAGAFQSAETGSVLAILRLEDTTLQHPPDPDPRLAIER